MGEEKITWLPMWPLIGMNGVSADLKFASLMATDTLDTASSKHSLWSAKSTSTMSMATVRCFTLNAFSSVRCWSAIAREGQFQIQTASRNNEERLFHWITVNEFFKVDHCDAVEILEDLVALEFRPRQDNHGRLGFGHDEDGIEVEDQRKLNRLIEIQKLNGQRKK
jgi:hypothetical protein